MSYLTRDLLSLSLSRAAGESVVLLIKISAPNGDGSYTSAINRVTVLARVVDLQTNEIQRLQAKGITINKGLSVAIAEELDKAPDQVIRADGTILKIVDYTISENGSVFVADVPALGAA